MISLIVASIIYTVIAFFMYRKWFTFKVFERYGIPHPPVNLLFGNSLDLWQDDRHEVVRKWGQKYGGLFGYYEGTVPVLVVADLHMIEQICLKQTTTFTGRWFAPIQPDTDKEPNNPLLNMMISKTGHWRIVRSASSHFFSPIRLCHTIPTIESKLFKIMEVIDTFGGRAFDIREPFQRYAMDALCAAAFGLELHLLDREHPFHRKGMAIYRNARQMVQNGVVSSPWIFKLINLFPAIQSIAKVVVHIIMKLPAGPLSPLQALINLIRDSINKHQISNESDSEEVQNEQPQNLLQHLCAVTKFSSNDSTPNNADQCPVKSLDRQHYLTEEQLMTNTVMFLLAGYETTSTTLAYATYVLATHPEVQEKLYKEICECLPDASQPLDYQTVMTKLKYLDMVCMETIRLFPEGINIINRFITEETSVRGVKMHESMNSVLVDLWSVHNDMKYWGPVPTSEFHPERFSPSYETANRPKSAFLGFGLGPRQCSGMRFALLELKLSLIRLVRRYRLLPPSEDAPKLVPVVVHLVMIPKGEVKVKFEPR